MTAPPATRRRAGAGRRAPPSWRARTGGGSCGGQGTVLVAFGADAVHPYLKLRLVKDGLVFKDPDSKNEFRLDAREALENLFMALKDTIKKVISKMGITTIEGYRGAMLFEAVGFGPDLMEFLGDFPSRLGGIGFKELVEDEEWRVQQATWNERSARSTPLSKRSSAPVESSGPDP